MEELLAAYRREGIDDAPYYWFTDQRKYGTCEHGGYGLGVEVSPTMCQYSLSIQLTPGKNLQRFLAWLANRYTVRECSLYPRYEGFRDLIYQLILRNGFDRWPGRATP
jgi:asparaginyl-tRNA synthetase